MRGNRFRVSGRKLAVVRLNGRCFVKCDGRRYQAHLLEDPQEGRLASYAAIAIECKLPIRTVYTRQKRDGWPGNGRERLTIFWREVIDANGRRRRCKFLKISDALAASKAAPSPVSSEQLGADGRTITINGRERFLNDGGRRHRIIVSPDRAAGDDLLNHAAVAELTGLSLAEVYARQRRASWLIAGGRLQAFPRKVEDDLGRQFVIDFFRRQQIEEELAGRRSTFRPRPGFVRRAELCAAVGVDRRLESWISTCLAAARGSGRVIYDQDKLSRGKPFYYEVDSVRRFVAALRGRPRGRPKSTRPNADRDATFFTWRAEGMTYGAIRDRWNREHPDRSVGTGRGGTDVAKKAIAAEIGRRAGN